LLSPKPQSKVGNSFAPQGNLADFPALTVTLNQPHMKPLDQAKENCSNLGQTNSADWGICRDSCEEQGCRFIGAKGLATTFDFSLKLLILATDYFK
jgi:hypothetical protein